MFNLEKKSHTSSYNTHALLTKREVKRRLLSIHNNAKKKKKKKRGQYPAILTELGQ